MAGQTLITFASLGFGLLVGLIPLLFSPTFRQMLRAIPPIWLVGIHAIRLAGFLFLALLDMNLLPAGFALPAGYGDMTVGLLALGLVVLFARNNPSVRPLAIGWNLLGLLDFVTALTTGGMFLAPFARQVAASGGSLYYLNFVLLIPSFAVPLYALLHFYSLFQLAAGHLKEPHLRADFHTEKRSLQS